MADYAQRTYTSASGTTFALSTSGSPSYPIGYIKESDIKVTVNNVVWTNATSGNNTYQFSGSKTVEQPSGGNIVLNSSVSGTTVVLERTTAIQEATVVYTAGSTLTSTDLNNADNQIRFGLQEFSDDYAALNTGTGTLPNLGAFLGGSDTWVSSDAYAATTAAIDNRVDSKIDTALTGDVSGGDGVTIVDNSPGAGQIRIDLDADIATLRNMQSGAASALALLTSTEIAVLDGAALTTTELNYVDGVTSAIQTQLDSKQTTNAKLTAIAALAASDGNFIVGDGSTWVAESGATARTSIGAEAASAKLTELATMAQGTADALAELTAAEVQIIDGATVSTTELNYSVGVTSSIQTQLNAKQTLDADLTAIGALSSADGNFIVGSAGGWVAESGATARTSMGAQTQDAQLDTLSGMQSGTASVLADSTALGATLAEINSICENRGAQTTITNSDAHIPTSGAVVDYVTGSVTAVGGFVTVATEVTFPNTQPDADVVVSVADAGGLSINSSGVASGATTAGGTAVTITGIPNALHGGVGANANPNVLVAGVGLQLVSSGSSNSYAYHKLLATESDVAQLSGDINDFNERYRVSNGAPSGTDHAGDLYYDTGTDKMLVRNAANNAWEEVQSIGNFYISTFSESFDGSRTSFTVSNAPTLAQQLIISINGVVQKPNSGTSQPAEGFALNGNQVIFSNPPAASSPYYAVVIGSSVNIGTPSANTVDADILQNGSVTTAKIAANAVDGTKIAMGSDAQGDVLYYDGTNYVRLAAGTSGHYLKTQGSGANPVWAAVSTTDSTKMPLAGGSFTGDVVFTGDAANVTWDKSADDLIFNDNAKAVFGTSSDGLEIYHDTSHSRIKDTGTGYLIINTNTGVLIKNGADDEGIAYFTPNGAVELMHANSKKFETLSNGTKTTGNHYITGDLYAEAEINMVTSTDGNKFLDVGIGTNAFAIRKTTGGDSGHENMIRAVGDGAVELYHNNVKTFLTDANGVRVLGPEGGSGILKIYADEGDDNQDLWQIVATTGGELHFQSYTSGSWEDCLHLIGNGAVELYYDDSKKLETTDSGIKVSSAGLNKFLIGSTDASGARLILDGDSNGDGSGSDYCYIEHGTDGDFAIHCDNPSNDAQFELYVKDGTEMAIVAASDGAVELYHNGTKQCETSTNGLAFPSGKGIDFSATADSGTTTTSELLDDYEIGTWTPTLMYYSGGWYNSSVTTTGGITAKYVKCGKLVQFSLKWTNFQHNSGGDHYAKITGLPYNTLETGVATTTYCNVFTANNDKATGMVSGGAIEFYIGTSWLLWDTSSGRYLYLAGTYEAQS